jgi:hypothetical protein
MIFDQTKRQREKKMEEKKMIANIFFSPIFLSFLFVFFAIFAVVKYWWGGAALDPPYNPS